MDEELGTVSLGSARGKGSKWKKGWNLTWTNAVEMMMPVPNCFNKMSSTFNLLGRNRMRKMGAKTPTALVPSMAKMSPIRSGTSYSRSTFSHFFALLPLSDPPLSDSPAPTQCLKSVNATQL